jgi:putative sugar O-methyltransferase
MPTLPPDERPAVPNWSALTDRTLDELKVCDPLFRPTSFWGPGLTQLLGDMEARGLETFKSWPTAGYWFYPRYGVGYTNATIDAAIALASGPLPGANPNWIRGALNASHEARRDFDVARMAWDQSRWPTDLDGHGEGLAGRPFQYFRFTGGPHGWTRPYLNYMLCMAALSRHADGPPRRVLEIGGGHGVLGEFLMQRDPEAVYVNLDIPPLMTVATWYLTELFGPRVTTYEGMAPTGPIDVAGSAVLPNYRLPDLTGEYDTFVNSFSFQEMEPDVVKSYVELVAARGVRYVVSLNSRLGKPKVSDGHAIGVVDPVTSDRIVGMFATHGFRLAAAYDGPLVNSAGQLVVMRRD